VLQTITKSEQEVENRPDIMFNMDNLYQVSSTYKDKTIYMFTSHSLQDHVHMILCTLTCKLSGFDIYNL